MQVLEMQVMGWVWTAAEDACGNLYAVEAFDKKQPHHEGKKARGKVLTNPATVQNW